MNTLIKLSVTLFLLNICFDAEARRRSKKEGFNFGATVISTDGQSAIEPNATSDRKRSISRKVSGVAPYIGYSFGTLGVGLRASNKTEQTDHQEVGTNNSQTKTEIKTISKLSDVSLFTRINFGKILFLEAGFGVYNQKSNISNQTTIETSSNTFEGSKEEFTLSGSGTGTHTALGFEVPVGSGFHFNGHMLVKNFEIRSDDGGPKYGDKQSRQTERDLNFGLSYYFD